MRFQREYHLYVFIYNSWQKYVANMQKKKISHSLIYSQTHLFIKHFLVQLIVLDTDHSKSKLGMEGILSSFLFLPHFPQLINPAAFLASISRSWSESPILGILTFCLGYYSAS